jgi:hypothetical protein
LDFSLFCWTTRQHGEGIEREVHLADQSIERRECLVFHIDVWKKTAMRKNESFSNEKVEELLDVPSMRVV